MSKKLTIEDAKKAAHDHGGELLSEVYVSTKTPLKWRCSEGHEWETALGSIRHNGSWCPYCSAKLAWVGRKETIEDMKVLAEQHGGKCLSKLYVNNSTKLTWECANKHIWDTAPTNIKDRGSWCPYCAKKSKNSDFHIAMLRELAEQKGGKLLSDTYKDSRTKLRWRCNKGHEWEAVSWCVRKDAWCPECGVDRTRRDRNYNWQGGVRSLNHFLRQMTSEWKREVLKVNDFTCWITGQRGGKLHVHHDIPFHKIRDKILFDLGIEMRSSVGDYSEEESKLIEKEFREAHEIDLGTPLTKEIHRLFHKTYGHKTNREQLVEFKERYLSGEFEEVKKK